MHEPPCAVVPGPWAVWAELDGHGSTPREGRDSTNLNEEEHLPIEISTIEEHNRGMNAIGVTEACLSIVEHQCDVLFVGLCCMTYAYHALCLRFVGCPRVHVVGR